MVLPETSAAFVSAALKLERANFHGNQLHAFLADWMARNNPHDVTSNRKDGRTEIRVILKEPLDELRFAGLFSDLLHNVRSAMDNAMFGIGHAFGARKPQGAFPAITHVNEWDGLLVNKRQLDGISDSGVLDVIRAWQPLDDAANWPHSEFVGVICGLNNRDKHRAMSAVFPSPEGLAVASSRGNGPPVHKVDIVEDDGLVGVFEGETHLLTTQVELFPSSEPWEERGIRSWALVAPPGFPDDSGLIGKVLHVGRDVVSDLLDLVR